MFDRDDLLKRIIPYRMSAVETLHLALELRLSWDGPQPMKIYFTDSLAIEGNSNAFTNPVIEAGLIHCRVLLEFLGLQVSRTDPTKLTNRTGRRPDDIGIEDFSNSSGALPLVSPQEACASYAGKAEDAEAALVSVFHMANKGLAHITAGLVQSPEQAELVEIASRGIPTLVVKYLYTRLQLPSPTYKPLSRRRDDC
jgi:hypothetical protein